MNNSPNGSLQRRQRAQCLRRSHQHLRWLGAVHWRRHRCAGAQSHGCRHCRHPMVHHPTIGNSSHRVVKRGDRFPTRMAQAWVTPLVPQCTVPRPYTLNQSSWHLALTFKTNKSGPIFSSGTLVPIDQVALGAPYKHPGCDS